MSVFHTYWFGMHPPARREFARRAKTTVGYLNQVAAGNKNIGPDLAMWMEYASEGELKVEQLRPSSPWEVVRGKAA